MRLVYMGTRITPLQSGQIDELIGLARAIWLAHYPTIISVEQIEYMLDQRYRPAIISAQLDSPDHWWHVLWKDGEMLGFSACERSDKPGQLKLDKLYLEVGHHGQGLGTQLLDHVQALARKLDCHTVYLQVNKHNHKAVDAYRRSGFTVREAFVFDIGDGFVMDDYVMEKRLDV